MVTLLRQSCTCNAVKFARVVILFLMLVLNGCSRPHEDTGDAKPIPESLPLLPNSIPPLDKELAGVYRYRAAPTGEIRSSLPADLDAVIKKIRRFEFNAVLLKAPTGQDGNDQCERVAVRCNPLGPISHQMQEMPWCYNYTFIPGTNVVYGVDQGLYRVNTETGEVERLLDATDYTLRAPFDSKRRELVLITRSVFLVKFHVDTNEVSKTKAPGFPSVSYPMAYDPASDRFLRLDPGEQHNGQPNIQLHEFDVERSLLSSRKIQSQVRISLDERDGWVSTYDATVMDGYLILVVRRTPQYEQTECQNICHVIDLKANQVIFSAEMVPQPASDPPSRENSEALSAEQALAKASVGGKYHDLIMKIPAPEDDLIHTTYREFGEYTGTQWRGYNLPGGHYIYVYPNWYVWRMRISENSDKNQRASVVNTPGQKPVDPRLEKAQAAYVRGEEEDAATIWESILKDPATPYAWYRATISLATHSAKHEYLTGAIKRLEPLGQKVLGEKTSVPFAVPSNQIAAEILKLLKSWHAELGQYQQAAIYAGAVKGTYYGTCGTYQAMYEANAIAEAKKLRQWAETREYHPSPRFTEMINGMTIADGGNAKVPVLNQLARFKRIVFEGSKLNDGGAALLQNLPQLEGVVSHDTQLTDRGLWSLAKLGKLEELVVPDARITGEGVRYLTNLPRLRILNLMNCPITDESARTLGSLKHLTHLALTHTRITDAGMAKLAGLTQLEHFGFPYQNITGKGLVHLSGMRRLRSVYLGCPSIDSQEMAPLANLHSLTTINIQTRSGAGNGLKHLKGLSNLKELILGDPTIKNHHLTPLKGLSVEKLSVWGTTVDDGCIDVILSMASLKHLQANGLRKLTPAGIRRLKDHPSLSEISLTDYCIPKSERTPLLEDMKPIKITYYAN